MKTQNFVLLLIFNKNHPFKDKIPLFKGNYVSHMDHNNFVSVIINPESGARLPNRYKDFIQDYFKSQSQDAVIHETLDHSDALAFIQSEKERNSRFFVTVGGDGTINTVASQLIDTEAVLMVVPTGSGNGLARHLGIPIQFKRSIQLFEHHEVKRIDCGVMNDIPFFCTAGLGFDAEVAHRFAQKGRRGLTTYIETLIQEYWKYKPQEFVIEFEEQVLRPTSFLITFANSAQYGNNAFISPDAKIDDGFLDMCLISEFPQNLGPLLGLKVITRRISTSSHYEMVRLKEAVVKRSAPGWAHFDGEPVYLPETLKFKVLPSVLNVCVPVANSR